MGPANRKSRQSTARSRARSNPHTRALNALTVAEQDHSSSRRKGKGKQRNSRHGDGEGDGENADEDDEEEYDDPNVEEGGDDEGNKWTIGRVNSDDDSELDSDEAMGESDEENFADFTFRGSSTRKKGKEDAEEGDDEEEDWGDEDGGEDLLQILDRKMREDDEEAVKGKKGKNGKKEEREKEKGRKRKLREEEEEDEEEEFGGFGEADDESDEIESQDDEGDEDDDSDEDESSEEDDDNMTGLTDDSDEETPADPTKLSALHTILNSLPTTSSDLPRAKRPRLQDSNELKTPSAYNITTTSQKLSLTDLLPTLDPSLKSSLKPLLKEQSSKSTPGVPGKLTVPLPKRQQDRLDRSVAYGKAKQELSRWTDTVKHNREAEHLHFPLTDPEGGTSGGGAGNRFVAATNAKPLTALESTVSGILKESNLVSEKQIAEFETLKANKLSVEDEQRRRAQLRMARELMFREEIRAKRIKKIKSKTYRRIHKKERERLAAQEAALAGDDEGDEEERERRRAEERMSLRHKQSRWAKDLKESGRAIWDGEARDEAVEMVRRGEELRKRIMGKSVGSNGEEESEEEEESDDDEFDEGGQGRKRLLRELDGVEKDGLGGDKDTRMGRLMQMKFMQNAQAAKKKENQETVARLKEDLEYEERGSQDEDEESEEEEETAGRRSFKPTGKTGKNESIPQTNVKRITDDGFRVASDDEGEVEFIIDPVKAQERNSQNTSSRAPVGGRRRGGLSAASLPSQIEDEPVSANPWTTTASTDGSRLRPSSISASATDSKTAKASAKLAKERRAALQAEKVAQGAVADDDVLVSTEVAILSTTTTSTPASKKTEKKAKSISEKATFSETIHKNASDNDDDDSNESTDDNDDETKTNLIPSIISKKNPLAIQNRDLVRRAFAGDDVQADFDAEKEREIEEDETKEIDETLPGWGTWSGAGINQKRKKAYLEKKYGKDKRFVKVKKGIDRTERRDGKLDRVIVNEKKVKKNIKYEATALPFPYETKAQYERALRLPIGKEWSTKSAFQESTMPRVIVKKGTVVEAMKRPLK